MLGISIHRPLVTPASTFWGSQQRKEVTQNGKMTKARLPKSHDELADHTSHFQVTAKTQGDAHQNLLPLPNLRTETTSWRYLGDSPIERRPSAIPMGLPPASGKGRYTVFGRKIAVWHDGKNWQAMRDACPHKGASLSLGTVQRDGGLKCNYHGRVYYGLDPRRSGDEKLSLCSEMAPYRIQESNGELWLSGKDFYLDGDVEIPFAAEAAEAGFYKIKGQRDMVGSFLDLHANTVDVMHLPTVHGQRMFMTEIPRPTVLDMFTQVFPYGMNKANPFLPFFEGKGSNVTVRSYPPYCAFVSIYSREGNNAVNLFLNAVPIFEPTPQYAALTPPRTRLVWTVARNFFRSPAFDVFLRKAIDWTVWEDGEVVEGQTAAKDLTFPGDTDLFARLRRI